MDTVQHLDPATAARRVFVAQMAFLAVLGTRYGMRRRAFLSKLGTPCVKPPWG